MKLKVDYALFQANVSSPGFLSPTISMARTETKHQEVEMEYYLPSGLLIIQMTKHAKPIGVPSTNIKDLVFADIKALEASELPSVVKK